MVTGTLIISYSSEKKKETKTKTKPRTSPVVQWLRLCPPNAGGLGSITGKGTRSHMPQLSACMPH